VAEGRPYVTCLLFPDLDYMREQKAELGMSEHSDAAFLASDVVRQELKKLIVEVNASLNRWERIRDYRFIATPISIQTEELTPTMKVRRHVINARYGALIDEMYAGHANGDGDAPEGGGADENNRNGSGQSSGQGNGNGDGNGIQDQADSNGHSDTTPLEGASTTGDGGGTAEGDPDSGARS